MSGFTSICLSLYMSVHMPACSSKQKIHRNANFGHLRLVDLFLNATMHLYWMCLSVRPSVHRSVRRSVRWSVRRSVTHELNSWLRAVEPFKVVVIRLKVVIIRMISTSTSENASIVQTHFDLLFFTFTFFFFLCSLLDVTSLSLRNGNTSGVFDIVVSRRWWIIMARSTI